jgi:hypothetical protein
MSDEVKIEEAPPAEIVPAKSEDKLEIEKEEQEAKEKTEEGEGEEKKEGETEGKKTYFNFIFLCQKLIIKMSHCVRRYLISCLGKRNIIMLTDIKLQLKTKNLFITREFSEKCNLTLT